MPAGVFAAAWIVMALGYSYSGVTKLISPSWLDGTALAHVLENPLARSSPVREWAGALPPVLLQLATWGGLALELLFAPLALSRRARPWIWLLMVGLHLSLLVLVDFADLTLGMLLFHAFTFDPAWVRARAATGRDTVFYDGSCGLCHRFVRFVLAEDRDGERFDFAPLASDACREALGSTGIATLPDSVVVRTADGRLLVRTAAVRRVMGRLGGLWRALAIVSHLGPTRVLDFVYDRIARVRRKLFRAPAEACPILPPHLRGRFRA